jgi:hypothetical protein
VDPCTHEVERTVAPAKIKLSTGSPHLRPRPALMGMPIASVRQHRCTDQQVRLRTEGRQFEKRCRTFNTRRRCRRQLRLPQQVQPWQRMDLRRGTLGAHQLGMRQQVPANVGKLRRWSGDSPSPARWSEDDTNFVRLTGQVVHLSCYLYEYRPGLLVWGHLGCARTKHGVDRVAYPVKCGGATSSAMPTA